MILLSICIDAEVLFTRKKTEIFIAFNNIYVPIFVQEIKSIRMNLLQVSELTVEAGNSYLIRDINFNQETFQKIAIAGATGSGKTTLLKAIAGLVQPSSGEVLFEGKRVKGPEEKLIPGNPDIAYLSQHFELLNNYKVHEILEMNNKFDDANASLIYKVCRVDHLLKRWTNQLSGGEKQRIALARLLVSTPKLLLLDEPYSNLDAIHKTLLKNVIADIFGQLKISCLLVSHDPIDVLSWAEEIVIMQEGEIIQKGSPENIYNYPINEYAAALFGKYTIMNPTLAKALSEFSDIEMNRINSFFRPSNFTLVSSADEGLQGVVKKVFFMGNYYELEVQIGDNKIILHHRKKINPGEEVFVNLL